MNGRMKVTATCVLSAALVLAGPALAADKIKIAVVGDSLCTNSEVPWPAILAQHLGDGYEVKTFAANGLTVLSNTYRSIWTRYEHVKAAEYRGDITLVCFGANAAKPDNWRRKGEWAVLYKRLIGMYQGANRKVYIVLPPPATTESPYGISREILHNETIPALKQIAKDTGCEVIDTHTPLAGRPDVTGADGLYPTPVGHQIMGAVVLKALTGKEVAIPPPKPPTKEEIAVENASKAVKATHVKQMKVGDVAELTPEYVADPKGDGPDGAGNTEDDTWGFWFELAHSQGSYHRLSLATATMPEDQRKNGIRRKVTGPIGAWLPNPKETEGWIFGSDWDGRGEGVWGDNKDNCVLVHPYNEKVFAGKIAITCRLPAGTYALSAKLTDLTVVGLDGVNWRVEVAEGGEKGKAAAEGKPFGDKVGPASVDVDVKDIVVEKGQLIRFIVDPNQNWGADMTRVDGLKIKRVK